MKNNLGWKRQKEKAETRQDKRGKAGVGPGKRNQIPGEKALERDREHRLISKPGQNAQFSFRTVLTSQIF